ncbi:MAG: hypothetical protein FJ303_12970 [Planctomycetes bacterium]|nr:hypothetical protein [Planctomycetota bacterium]
MPQLIGLQCVKCQKGIASVLEGFFCDGCGNPVHRKCGITDGSALADRCPLCGGDPQSVIAKEVLQAREPGKGVQNTDDQLPTKEVAAWDVIIWVPLALLIGLFANRIGLFANRIGLFANRKAQDAYGHLPNAVKPWILVGACFLPISVMLLCAGLVVSDTVLLCTAPIVAVAGVIANIVGLNIARKDDKT